MNVVGLEVGKNYAVSCCLSEFPPVAQQYFKQHRKEFEKLPNNQVGIAKLLALKPNAISRSEALRDRTRTDGTLV